MPSHVVLKDREQQSQGKGSEQIYCKQGSYTVQIVQTEIGENLLIRLRLNMQHSI